MAILTGTYTAYDAVGIREELSDVIYRISPEETPFMSNVGKGTVDRNYFEWQTDQLAAVNTANAFIDGNDYSSFAALVPTVRLGNYTQISAKSFMVSGRLNRVRKAGRKQETAYQMALAAAALKRDLEGIATQNNVALPGAEPATAGTTAGLESFIQTNALRGATGANPILSGVTSGYPTTAPVDGTTRPFTETLLKTLAQQVWAASGAGFSMLMVGGPQKQEVSSFSGIATLRHETGAKLATIVGAADAYVSDFGTIQVVPNRFQRARTAFLLNPDFLSVVFLRPFEQFELAKTGDAEKRLLLVDWGVKVNHQGAIGAVADIT